MIRTFYTILCLALCFSTHGQIDSLRLEYDYFTLPNGLEVIFQPDQNVDQVSVEFWIKNGTSMDRPEQYGLQHFFEHVLPYSPMDSISKNKFFDDYLKGSNAQVKKDFSRFYLKVVPEGIDLALERASGRLMAGADRITERRVEYERKRVLAEIKRNARNPKWSAKGSLAIHEGTFGKGHPYAANGYGNIKNNEGFSLDDFRQRYNNVVYAENITLFVVGHFDDLKVKQLVYNYFGNIKSKQKRPIELSKPVLQSNQSISMKAPHPEDVLNTVIFSWAIPEWTLKDDAALKLVAAHLNNSFTSKNGLPLSVVKSGSYTDMHKVAGQFYIEIKFSDANDSTKIDQLVSGKIKDLLKKHMTPHDLNLAKKSEIENIKDMQENLGFGWSRTELLGKGLLFRDNPSMYFERLKIQQELTAKQLKRMSRKWLNKKPFKVSFTANDL
ncbi:MAG: pitrilysin family protein [Bacteroidota bacterium]